MIGRFEFSFDTSVLRRRMGVLADDVMPYVKKAFEALAQWGKDTVSMHTPFTRTGTDIRGMWQLTSSEQGTITQFIVKNTYKDPQIILWMEGGTKPHEIPVGEFGFLHFFTYEGDEIYTRRSVWHPGTVAWRMVEQTRREVAIKVEQYVQETFDMVDRMMREGGTV